MGPAGSGSVADSGLAESQTDLPAHARVDLASLQLPPGTYSIVAEVTLHNFSSDENANVDCRLDAGSGYDDVSVSLKSGGSTYGDTLMVATQDASSFVADLHCLATGFTETDVIDANNERIVATKVG